MPYWEEPKYNDPEEIESPTDVVLPRTMHHMQAKAELDLLVDAGAIGHEEAERLMMSWQARGKLDGEDVVEAAIDVLEEHGVVPESEAADLRERAA
jgi:hypothetical protein